MKPAAWIGSAEAETLLSVARSFLLKLLNSGEIQSARLVTGAGSPRWIMKRADVLALKERGFRKYARSCKRQQTLLWERYFGEPPRGYSPVFRDGNPRNIVPENLVLKPQRHLWRMAARGERKRKKKVRRFWNPEREALLRERFPRTKNRDLAKELGTCLASIVRRARQCGLRKDPEYLRDAKSGNSMPVGTERYHPSTDTVYVKVTDTGQYRAQWRPKAHVVWEKHHGRPVPTRNVIFKDGNNRNFDPANLVALSKNETSALVNARRQMMPEPLRKLCALTIKIKQEASKQMLGAPYRTTQQKPNSAHKRSSALRGQKQRWTPDMDAALTRDYSLKLRADLAAGLGVTESAIRQRARRLGLVRSPQMMMAEARAKVAAQVGA